MATLNIRYGIDSNGAFVAIRDPHSVSNWLIFDRLYQLEATWNYNNGRSDRRRVGLQAQISDDEYEQARAHLNGR